MGRVCGVRWQHCRSAEGGMGGRCIAEVLRGVSGEGWGRGNGVCRVR